MQRTHEKDHDSCLAVPSCIVVDVNDASCSTRIDASLNEIVILLHVGRVDVTAEHIISKKLPPNRQAEGIETIVFDEVVHLALAVMTIVFQEGRPSARRSAGSVGIATKVKSRNVYAVELEGSSR